MALETENLLIFDGEKDLDSIRKRLRSLAITYGFSGKDTSNILKAIKEFFNDFVLFGGQHAELRISKWKDSNQRTIGMEIIIKEFDLGFGDSIDGNIDPGFGFSFVEDLIDELIIVPNKSEISATSELIFTLRFLRNKNLTAISRQTTDNKDEMNESKVKVTQTFQWSINGESIPRSGELRNGDKVFFIDTDDIIVGAVIDGMGHGYSADIASLSVIEIIEKNFLEPLEKLINFLHQILQNTVGAQCFIIRIDKISQIAEYVGIGNIRAYLIVNNSRVTDLVTKDGTLGKIMPHFQIEHLSLNETSTIIMHSDGISRKWLENIRGLKIKKFGEKELINELISNFRKPDDDSTILVIQNN